MKDYYAVLGVPEDAGPEEIRSAFRRLAFQYHPDKNPGREREAAERFKEINEAYSVLCDESRRRQYDAFRRGAFAGARRETYAHMEEEILRRAFASESLYQELSRMFAQMGLRFDEEFQRRVFFGGRGVRFEFRMGSWDSGPQGSIRRGENAEGRTAPFDGRGSSGKRAGFVERLALRMIGKLAVFTLRRSLGIGPALPERGRDIHKELKISAAEARTGCRKRIRYRRGKEKKTLEVSIPAGITSGTKIRLTGMGGVGEEPGDLYLRVTVKQARWG